MHVNALEGDYYEYDDNTYEMRGQHSGTVYRLGQKVRIRVKDVDRLCRTIDFVLQ